jgi:protease-4
MIFLLFAGFLFLSKNINNNISNVSKDSIGVVEVTGVIKDSKDELALLKKYAENKKIKAIIVKINSPGGAVVPSQEIYSEILKIKKKKPVYAYFQSLAASGAYYIGCACNKIIANPGTITGSIGVILEFTNFKELSDKLGIKAIVIKSGKFKDVGNPFRPITDEEKNLLKGVILSIYSQFIKAVSKNRNIPIEKLKKIADGRVFSGEQALNLKLVDKLGNFSDSINIIKKDCHLSKKPKIVYSEEEPTFIKKLIENSEKSFIKLLEKNFFMVNYSLK